MPKNFPPVRPPSPIAQVKNMDNPNDPLQIVVDRLQMVDATSPDMWRTIAEIYPESQVPINPLRNPRIAIRQHTGNKELRVDIYDCNEGLGVSVTRGTTNEDRAKAFRDITVDKRLHGPPIRVRFLGEDLELRS